MGRVGTDHRPAATRRAGPPGMSMAPSGPSGSGAIDSLAGSTADGRSSRAEAGPRLERHPQSGATSGPQAAPQPELFGNRSPDQQDDPCRFRARRHQSRDLAPRALPAARVIMPPRSARMRWGRFVVVGPVVPAPSAFAPLAEKNPKSIPCNRRQTQCKVTGNHPGVSSSRPMALAAAGAVSR